eukprot:TRINITY_DN26849_c0_g1_i1.p1 TRINITY_DN26849_c0_g1~~TRINITY_DN26849_c0_g1_i1.p1  ORF type:complete len:354 (+),score=80.91 TRINITY_DN26849_c0_g1_i1:162-1223(+)
MKERHRWKSEEDALLRAYVKQYGPREWNLVSQRMNVPLDRDAKSCLERWKNYLKPGIKKGSLTDEEQQLVIRLQAKHGNKWKKIAAEIPGRTAKRLGKWWEVFKEKQQREQQLKLKESNNHTIEQGKYDQILETFAEKLVKERATTAPFLMATSNGGAPPQPLPPSSLLPPWLSNSNGPSTPSVALTLSPSTTVSVPPVPWHERGAQDNIQFVSGSLPQCGGSMVVSELAECCRELDEGYRAWVAHKKETTWRLRRVEMQLESEKTSRRREKMEEIETKMRALREEQKAELERIEQEYKEQILGLRRDAEAKEQKLAELWAAKHLRLTKFLEQMGCRPPPNCAGVMFGDHLRL